MLQYSHHLIKEESISFSVLKLFFVVLLIYKHNTRGNLVLVFILFMYFWT